MGGAPPIEWLRPGVGYTPVAAASMRRLESAFHQRYGRQRDCNSSYRDWGLQLSMWQAWTAWTEGRGPKPNHSMAIHPNLSKHCAGLADDTDEWTTPGYIALAAEHGWIRTAADNPTERHHFEYQVLRDKHFGKPAGGGASTFNPKEEPDMEAYVNVGGTVKHLIPGGEHSFTSQAQYENHRRDVNFLRDRGIGFDAIEPPPLTSVAEVTAAQYELLRLNFGIPKKSAAPVVDVQPIVDAVTAVLEDVAGVDLEAVRAAAREGASQAINGATIRAAAT